MVNFHKRFPEATDDGDDQYRQPESDGVIQTGTNSSEFCIVEAVNDSLEK